MGKVKCNKGGLASLVTYVEQLKTAVDSVFTSSVTAVETENNNAITALNNKVVSPTKDDGNGNQVENEEYTALENKKKVAKANADKISAALKKQSDIDAVLDNIIKGLTTIRDAVDKFEGESGEVEFTVDAEVRTVTNGVTGIEVQQLVFEVTDPDGTTREFTMSELLNAFYTTQGMEMNSVYQAALLRQELGLDPLSDEDIVHVLQTSKSIMNFVFDIGMYGISSEEDLKTFKKNLKDAGFNVAEDVETLIKGVDFGDDDLRKKALNYLLGATNGAIFPGAVSAGISGLYGLYNNDSKVELKEDKTDGTDNNGSSTGNSYGPGGSYGGGYTGGSPSSGTTNPSEKPGATTPTETSTETPTETPTEPTETPTESPTEPTESSTEPTETITETVTETAPGVVSPTEGYTDPLVTPEDASELPTVTLPSIPDGIERDYDDLARQQFEAQGEEKIAEHRAEIIEKANRLFEIEDKAELKTILKQYGYSDSDVEIIVQDRDLTISAMVSGDQREQLTKIAQDLAKKDGVTEFDTVYDNEQKAASLTDGTTTKFLSIVSSDEGVKKAYEALTASEKSYTEANTAATAAMATVVEAKAKIAEITNSIGEGIKADPSQWDEKTLKSYNDEVTELYEKSIKLNGDAKDWTKEQKAEYDEKVAEIKDKYAEKTSVANGEATWTKEQAQKYNEAVKEYNEAVKKAKEATSKLEEAKNSYTQARTDLDTAKEDFYKKVVDEQKAIIDNNNQVNIAPIADTQSNSGNVEISGIVVTEQGASIGAPTTTTNGNEQIVNDDQVVTNNGIQIELPNQAVGETQSANAPKEVIVNDDGEAADYGIPIVDIGSSTSGSISNNDIKF